uniref:Kidney mitochondrial carrier protein 1 n=1 Tax=Mus spicilegus TaxID=10103 RepID=A0A8C6HQM6_MUSSI
MSALNWKPFVYGGLASITAECGTFPIDLTKTRLQIQGQTNDANFREIRYRGMLHALMRIGREEGLRALYSGIAPAMLRQASYGTIKIGTYQSLKRLAVERPEDETLLVNVVCGILSGVISSAIANPTDVLKIRMQAQNSAVQGGMIDSFISIYQQEGTRGLWKGVSLTAQRAAIVVGVELPVYDITKKHLILSGLMGDTVATHFLSSFTCGLVGALASNPVDVVRTRMMNQRALRNGRCAGYKGTLDCLLQVRDTSCLLAALKCLSTVEFSLGWWHLSDTYGLITLSAVGNSTLAKDLDAMMEAHAGIHCCTDFMCLLCLQSVTIEKVRIAPLSQAPLRTTSVAMTACSPPGYPFHIRTFFRNQRLATALFNTHYPMLEDFYELRGGHSLCPNLGSASCPQ